MGTILIKGGTVIDGTGSPPKQMDVQVSGTRISAVAKPGEAKGSFTIDAKNLVVCPGFIDIHTHSELHLLATPLSEAKIRQGVTTELVGNCGGSPAPLLGAARETAKDYARLLDLEIDWSTLDEYFLRVSHVKTSVNVAALIGADTLRQCVIGNDDVKASPKEIERMKELLAEAMMQGAFGLSSGLIYAPGCYSTTQELIALASTAGGLGGIYTSHIRGEGRTLIEAVAEAIEIGEKGGLPVEISHHKATGKPNWGKVKLTLKMIEEARARGVEVGFDVYPYTASSTSIDAILPPWARDGGKQKILERLKDPATRARIADSFERDSNNFENTVREDGWENITVVGLAGGPLARFENKSMAAIADELNKSPADTAFDLIIEQDLNVWGIFHEISEEDMMLVLKHELACIGSDGDSEAPYGPTGKMATHPRAYGTFPRVLRRYALDKHLFPLEEAIRKMTSLPAARMGLDDRGVLAKGMAADIVVFDPKKVRDLATYEDSHRYPEGIVHVLVNGAITIENSEHTKERAGVVLRHKPSVA